MRTNFKFELIWSEKLTWQILYAQLFLGLEILHLKFMISNTHQSPIDELAPYFSSFVQQANETSDGWKEDCITDVF